MPLSQRSGSPARLAYIRATSGWGRIRNRPPAIPATTASATASGVMADSARISFSAGQAPLLLPGPHPFRQIPSPAEPPPGHADERGHAALGGSVTGHGGGPAGRGDRGCRPGVDVIDDHPATLGDEAAGKRGADPAARPGHHHAGTGYRLHHGSFRK